MLTVLFQVDITVLPTQEASGLGDLAQSLIFPAVLFAGLFFLSRRGGGVNPMGGPGGAMGFGKSKAEIQMVPDTGVTFDDVAGCDGAKLELAEVVDFLKQPEAYTKNGCRIPRGVILDGPPGTGKTLLAKAVAGEAGVPFISISGSEVCTLKWTNVSSSKDADLTIRTQKPFHSSLRCLSVLEHLESVISLDKPKRMRPASSSLTRSTQLVVNVVPDTPAATTSVSKL